MVRYEAESPSKRIAALSLYPVLDYIEVKKWCIFSSLPKESICFLNRILTYVVVVQEISKKYLEIKIYRSDREYLYF